MDEHKNMPMISSKLLIPDRIPYPHFSVFYTQKHDVLPEQHLLPRFPERRQCLQRLDSANSRFLIGGGNDTTRARLDTLKPEI